MNIFILDHDFALNAQYHFNKHVVKMPTEAAQMLGTAYRLTHGEQTRLMVEYSNGWREKDWWLIDTDEVILSKGNLILKSWKVMGVTHSNHPCTKWVLESQANFKWLQRYALALNTEWKYRYEHTKNHSSVNRLIQTPVPNIPDIELTPFAQAMADEYKDEDPVKAYRNYFRGAKMHLLEYKKRSVPDWLK